MSEDISILVASAIGNEWRLRPDLVVRVDSHASNSLELQLTTLA